MHYQLSTERNTLIYLDDLTAVCVTVQMNCTAHKKLLITLFRILNMPCTRMNDPAINSAQFFHCCGWSCKCCGRQGSKCCWRRMAILIMVMQTHVHVCSGTHQHAHTHSHTHTHTNYTLTLTHTYTHTGCRGWGRKGRSRGGGQNLQFYSCLIIHECTHTYTLTRTHAETAEGGEEEEGEEVSQEAAAVGEDTGEEGGEQPQQEEQEVRRYNDLGFFIYGCGWEGEEGVGASLCACVCVCARTCIASTAVCSVSTSTCKGACVQCKYNCSCSTTVHVPK
jgi:hypothetical protein